MFVSFFRLKLQLKIPKRVKPGFVNKSLIIKLFVFVSLSSNKSRTFAVQFRTSNINLFCSSTIESSTPLKRTTRNKSWNILRK